MKILMQKDWNDSEHLTQMIALSKKIKISNNKWKTFSKKFGIFELKKRVNKMKKKKEMRMHIFVAGYLVSIFNKNEISFL